MAYLFKLSNSSGVPYYRQIVNLVTYGVANGLLKPGERLPTVRQLAVDLSVNLNTIVKAYSELELKGIINTQQGTGSFISETGPDIDPGEKEKGLERLCADFLNEASLMGVNAEKAISVLERMSEERQTTAKGKE